MIHPDLQCCTLPSPCRLPAALLFPRALPGNFLHTPFSMATLSSPDIFYVAASIVVGSAIATYLLRFIDLDIRLILSSKAGSNIEKIARRCSERFLVILTISDPLSPPSASRSQSTRGYFEILPNRHGVRPQIEGTSKPVQKTQTPAIEQKNVVNRLRSLIIDIPNKFPEHVYLGPINVRAWVADHSICQASCLQQDKVPRRDR